MNLLYPVARVLGRIAEIGALSVGVPMSISLVDESGDPIYFGFMDNALPASREVAVSKAYTAAVLRMDTRTVGKMAAPGGSLYGIQNTHGGRIILFGGGLPLSVGKKIVGGVGISGGSVDEDEEVAFPVQQAFEEMVKCAVIFQKALPEGVLSGAAMDRLEDSIWIKLEAADTEDSVNHTAAIVIGALLLAAAG